ncbi:MAG TPA: heme-copper oxidase subunit III [Opitutaceae bacterium]|nr:heme-copper oxidase subunit III [Opitutaceae bacterium]
MSSHAATIDHHHDPSTSTGIPNKKLLMWAFLASDCMFFGALIATHLIYRLHPPAGNPDPKVVFNPALTSFSTFILLMSSLMMALAVNAIQKGNVKSMRWSLLTTIFFGCIFLFCQVFEFTEFVNEKHMTITNSILGSTFFTLTGTHGTHVAIGVLWLTLMYIRSFKPAGEITGAWLGRAILHLLVFAATIVLTMHVVLTLVHGALDHGFNGAMLGEFFRTTFIAFAAMLAGYGILRWLARPAGPIAFDEHNAIDVESMGLYWHFVDIVWIVIFTAVYLLEYI